MSHISYMSRIEKSIIAGHRSELPKTCQVDPPCHTGLLIPEISTQVPEYVQLLVDCWQHEPDLRPSFGAAVKLLTATMEQQQPKEAQYDDDILKQIIETKKERVRALHALPAFQYFGA